MLHFIYVWLVLLAVFLNDISAKDKYAEEEDVYVHQTKKNLTHHT